MDKRTAVTAATLIAAAAFPSLAHARPAEPMRAIPTPAATSMPAAAPAPVSGGGGGETFEWGDAGIGAAGAAALMTAGMAATVARRRRAERAVG
jgi:hypothetical protein